MAARAAGAKVMEPQVEVARVAGAKAVGVTAGGTETAAMAAAAMVREPQVGVGMVEGATERE